MTRPADRARPNRPADRARPNRPADRARPNPPAGDARPSGGAGDTRADRPAASGPANRAVVALGSNIDPARHVPAALQALRNRCRVLAESDVVRTRPIGGPAGQDDHWNTAVLIETNLDRAPLKAWLRQVEADLGRVRGPDKFAPRTIDLDIVVWNGEVVDDDVNARDFLRDAVRQLLPELEA